MWQARGKMRKKYKIFVGKSKRKRPLRRSRNGLLDNIKIIL
jgi:hypothetical protein